MTKMHTSGGEKWAGVHYCFLVLPSFHTLCTDASISITLGARVDHAAGALYGASGSAWMEQANFFLSGFVKIQLFAVNLFWLSSMTHSAVYVSFETLSVNCKRVKVLSTNL